LLDGEDEIMRPVMAGLIKFESLIDGTLTLEHIELLNATLDNRRENEARYREAQEDRR
jgi:hypothetical protein